MSGPMPLSRAEFPRHMSVREAQKRLAARGLRLICTRYGLAVGWLH